MGVLTATIAGVSVDILDTTPAWNDVMEMRSVLSLTVKDSAGTLAFFRGDPVLLTDSVTGKQYQGFVQTSDPQKTSPDPNIPEIMHTVTCMDRQYGYDKRSNSQNYVDWQAGDIAVDLNQRVGSQEGVTVAAALHSDRSTADFSTGTLNGTVATTNTTDGDLELTPAGSTVTISELVMADWSTGVLTGVTANAFSLTGINGNRISTAYDVSAAGVLGSSHIHWNVVTPQSATFTMSASTDSGVTWQTCTNDAAVPGLFAGQNMAGQTLMLKEVFASADNITISTLLSVSVVVTPAAACTKTDVLYAPHLQADWNAGTLTGLTAAADNTLTIPVSYAYGAHNTFDNGGVIYNFQTSGIAFQITNSAAHHTHIQVTGPGTFTDMTYQSDLQVSEDFGASNTNEIGMTYLSPQWNNTANTFGYCAMLTQTVTGGSTQHYFLSLIRGSAGGTRTVIGTSTELTQTSQITLTGISTIKIVYTASTHNHKVFANGVQIFNVTDSTFTSAANIGVYATSAGNSGSGGSDPEFPSTNNFSVTSNSSGTATWVSPATSLSSATTYGNSVLRLVNTVLGSTLLVESSINGGSTYATDTIDSALPGLTSGDSLSGKSLVFRLTFTFAPNLTPIVTALRALVVGFYTSSGTRTTAPLGIDTMIRGNSSGNFGTGTDGQSYTKTGTATVGLTSDKATIANTTGDCHMVYGSITGTDMDATVDIALSASTISGGLELRYVDTNNFYRLTVSTTAITITKKVSGSSATVATASVTLTTGTTYILRFRVIGSVTVTLYGRVWLAGTAEPDDATWNVTGAG